MHCRALEFVHAFLESVLTGEEDLVVCANVAYEKSLKRYHGWLVRGIFKVSQSFKKSQHKLNVAMVLVVGCEGCSLSQRFPAGPQEGPVRE